MTHYGMTVTFLTFTCIEHRSRLTKGRLPFYQGFTLIEVDELSNYLFPKISRLIAQSIKQYLAISQHLATSGFVVEDR